MRTQSKFYGMLSMVGLLLFLPTFIIITIHVNQGNYLQELTKILSQNDMNILKEFYRTNPTPLIYDVIDFICIAGYVCLGVFYPLYFIYKINRYKILNIFFCILTVIVGLSDIIETIIIVIGGINGFKINNGLMSVHVLFTYIKGLIWIVFLWELFLSIILIIKRISSKKYKD